MAGQWVGIRTHDGGKMAAYLAHTSREGGPGVVVGQESYGANKTMRATADWLAAAGFNVLCPDLYWRQQPRVELDDQQPADCDKAAALMAALNLDLAIRDLQSAIDLLLRVPACKGKAGCVGYGLGGRLAYLAAARTEVDAVVGYYPLALEQHLGQAKNIHRPVMLHIATADDLVPPMTQLKIKRVLDPHERITYIEYKGAAHAFARRDSEMLNAEQAEIADRRTVDFLKRHLV